MPPSQTQPQTTTSVSMWQRLPDMFYLVAPWLLGIQTAITVARVYFSNRPWMIFEYDDFFYYLKVAVNLANGHGSTYNGIVPTNGYHPLWLLILTGFCHITQDGKAILAFVGVATTIAAVVTFLASRKILVTAGVERLAASALSLYVAVYSCREFFSGMEAVLTIPLALLLISRIQSGNALSSTLRAFLTGLLSSLVILARLDSAILVALLSLAILLNEDYRKQVNARTVVAFIAGLTPFAFYLWTNVHFFGVLMPVSGMAKQLRPHMLPTGAVVFTVLHSNLSTKLHFFFVFFSLIAAVLSYRKLRDTRLMVIMPALLFPFIYYAALSWLSDWWLSDWYFYAIRIALCPAFAFWLTRPQIAAVARNAVASAALVVVGLVAVLHNSWLTAPISLYQAGVDLHNFEATHPGIYAMGDRAGKVGYLLDNPMIQLEGLVMDKGFLAHMKRAEDLHTVFRDYHVKYYIGTSHQPFSGCFTAVESYQAGPTSPRLHGEFCEPPVARFQHGDVETLVYDVGGESGTANQPRSDQP